MGMFDNVNFKMNCPNCGKEVDDFQTKDHHCALNTIDPDLVDDFYSSCDNCKTWISFERPYVKPSYRNEPFTMDEVESIGFKMKLKNR